MKTSISTEDTQSGKVGYHRGGWYISRRLDKITWHIDNRSEDRIVPSTRT